MQTLLAVAVLVASVALLVPAFFVCWWLTGYDGEALNPVAPILGIGVLATAVGSIVVAARLDTDPSNAALALMAAPVVLLVLAMPFAGNDTTGKVRFREGREGILVLSITPLLALITRLTG